MGLFKKLSKPYNELDYRPNTNGNPDPKHFRLKRIDYVCGFLIIKVQYPDCLNYEGCKILVYDKGVTWTDLDKQKVIDPHFSGDKKYISPIARFEPTERGWNMAILFASKFTA